MTPTNGSIVRIDRVSVDPQPARLRDATCSVCGRRGTWASRLDRGEDTPDVVTRYCRACWPAAQKKWFAEARFDELLALRELWSQARLARFSEDGAPAKAEPITQSTFSWHWSLAVGTHWRAWRLSSNT